jgi:DNA-binding transcriptional regulator YiaG
MIDQQEGVTRVVDHFDAEDFGAPFKIVLDHCVPVTFDKSGNMLSYTIPDPDGLMRVVVLTRILNARKLTGPDIKFLRKAVGVKQKDLAPAIELKAETLSRCEAGAQPIGPASEKLLRLFLFKTTIKHHKLKDCEVKTKLEEALDALFDLLQPVSVHDVNEGRHRC